MSVVLFGLAHALTIVPIWDRLAGGLPFGLLGGVTVGWVLFEMRRAGRFWGVLSGLGFGLVMWAVLLPMTLLTVALRQAGFHDPDSSWEIAAALALTSAAGYVTGWLTAHSHRAALATALAGVALAIAQAGPVPATNSVPAAALFVALAVLYPASGLVLAILIAMTAGVVTPRR